MQPLPLCAVARFYAAYSTCFLQKLPYFGTDFSTNHDFLPGNSVKVSKSANMQCTDKINSPTTEQTN